VDLTTAIDLALADYRGDQGDYDSTDHEAVDAIQQTTSHGEVNRWLADHSIDDQVAAAYHLVLDSTLDELAAALATRA
jgi:hypothetical protein